MHPGSWSGLRGLDVPRALLAVGLSLQSHTLSIFHDQINRLDTTRLHERVGCAACIARNSDHLYIPAVFSFPWLIQSV